MYCRYLPKWKKIQIQMGNLKKRDKFLTSVFPGIIYLTNASKITYAT